MVAPELLASLSTVVTAGRVVLSLRQSIRHGRFCARERHLSDAPAFVGRPKCPGWRKRAEVSRHAVPPNSWAGHEGRINVGCI